MSASSKKYKFAHGEPPGFGKALLNKVFVKLDEKDPIIVRIIQLLEEHRLLQDEKSKCTMRLCMDEALVNAVKHGNKHDESKCVQVTLYVDHHRWGLRVEDEGCGFAPADVPDPEDDESLMLERGRGVLLMSEYMDEVTYYHGGRCLLMVKQVKKGQ